MNGVIDWGDFTPNVNGSGNKSGDRLDFLWLKTGNAYKVRLVAKPVIFYKYFFRKDGKLRTAICEDPRSCPVGMAHPELDTPGERFAILVIDRADGKMKVMEFPKSVFLSIKSWWTHTKQNPGGDNGVDWVIEVSGSGKTGTKYTTTATSAAPFTNEEKHQILKVIKNEDGTPSKYLEKTFECHSPEIIEKRLFGDWEDRTNGAAHQASSPAAAPVPPASAPAAEAPVAAGNIDIDW